MTQIRTVIEVGSSSTIGSVVLPVGPVGHTKEPFVRPFSPLLMMKRWAGIGLISGVLMIGGGNTSRTDHLQARTLAVHNATRERVGVGDLRWDSALEADARSWAQHLARIGRLEHSPNEASDPDPQGENLWAGTAGYYSVDAMSQLWARERQNYKPRAVPMGSLTGNFEDVGHYTQMVWRSTSRVGCALVRGAKDEFFVCRYGEGGNVVGERPY